MAGGCIIPPVMKFPPKFLEKYFPAQGRHRGRSVAAHNARVNLIAACGVVGALLAAIIYAVAISGGDARPDSVEQRNIPRWWTAAQAETGAELYKTHCAECHGKNAAGTVDNWREENEDGTYPPSPLDGSAQSWHNDMGKLRRVIRFGGAAGGGTMPAFGEELTAEEVDAVIAHFQSFWPEDIYRRWDLRERRRK